MRIPLTKYGLPQVVFYPAVVLVVMVIYAMIVRRCPETFCSCSVRSVITVWFPELVLFAVLIWMLSFFRDPLRQVPQGDHLLLSPADGTVSDVEVLDEYPGFEGPVQRVGIFLSIFNVHINRVPCAVRIDQITYKKGQFKNALDPESARVNESNDIAMTRLCEPTDPLLVRQISGAIARRIVCKAEPNQTYVSGQQFGMIKFGSRTELYYPIRDNVFCKAKVGDKVQAGLTVLAEYSLDSAVVNADSDD